MAELKAQLYLLEKEKKALELKLSTREAQEQAYLVHIEHLKSEVEDQKEQRMRSLSSTSSSGKEKPGKVGTGWHGDTLSAGITPAFTLSICHCLGFLAVHTGARDLKKPSPHEEATSPIVSKFKHFQHPSLLRGVVCAVVSSSIYVLSIASITGRRAVPSALVTCVDLPQTSCLRLVCQGILVCIYMWKIQSHRSKWSC